MIGARLCVERGSVAASAEEWGDYEFLGLPSPGDRVMVVREDQENYLTVLCVHHRPSMRGSSTDPAANVVAKWTGTSPKVR